jgi:hypothetical protein
MSCSAREGAKMLRSRGWLASWRSYLVGMLLELLLAAVLLAIAAVIAWVVNL